MCMSSLEVILSCRSRPQTEADLVVTKITDIQMQDSAWINLTRL